MAALTAGRAGARVILADEDFVAGGRLNAESTRSTAQAAATDWVAHGLWPNSTAAQCRVMTRTTVFGAFDHGIYGAVEMSDHRRDRPGRRARRFGASIPRHW